MTGPLCPGCAAAVYSRLGIRDPEFKHPPIKKILKRPEINVSLTTIPNPRALTANLHALQDTFCNADIMPSSNMELRALHEADPGGKVRLGSGGALTFITMGGLTYERGHGRNRCSAQCQAMSRDELPNNCGYHRQWLIPFNFKLCSEYCQGAFCGCMNEY